MEEVYIIGRPMLSWGWFMTRALTTSAGELRIAATNPEQQLQEDA